LDEEIDEDPLEHEETDEDPLAEDPLAEDPPDEDSRDEDLLDEDPLVYIPRLIMHDVWQEDEDGVAGALCQLGDLCYAEGDRDEAGRKENGELIFRYGGHAVILKTLQRFSDNVDGQTQGCRAIGESLFDLPLQFAEDVGAIGMVEVILKAMASFLKIDFCLQKAAIGTFHNLLDGCTENSERFAKAQGVVALVAAMRNFPECRVIQEIGCTIISECIELLENIHAWIAGDALSVVSNVFTNSFLGNESSVKDSARKALKAFAKRY
jgi:hypothetical protein